MASLQIKSKGDRYKFRVLPNGLSSGPRIFIKIMKAVISYLCSQHNILLCFYIDDTTKVRKNPEEVARAVMIMLELQELSFKINKENSVISPTRKLTFLSFIINANMLNV